MRDTARLWIMCGVIAFASIAQWRLATGARWGDFSNADQHATRRIGPIGRDGWVEQSFIVQGERLTAVALTAFPGDADITPAARIRLELFDTHNEGAERTLLRADVMSAHDAVRARPLAFRFPSLPHRPPHRFSVRITLLDAAVSDRIFLAAAEAERYPDGSLLVNGTKTWGDLAFSLEVEPGSLLRADVSRPLALTLVAVANLSLLVLLWFLARRPSIVTKAAGDVIGRGEMA